MTKEIWKKEIKSIVVVIVTALITAFAFHSFVYPNDFIPAGVDGICTLLQKLTGVNAAWFSISINALLLAVAFFFLRFRYTFYTLIFNVLVSALLVVFEKTEFVSFHYETDKIIPTLVSGALLGMRAGFLFKIGATTGGVDIIASMIHKKNPYFKMERFISIFCYAIIGISYFVYWDITSVVLSIIQMFIYEKAITLVMSDRRNALEFKIVTKTPNEIKRDILASLRHGATVVESKGVFLEEGNYMIFVVVNYRQAAEFVNLMRKYPDAFIYSSEVNGVYGNFRWSK